MSNATGCLLRAKARPVGAEEETALPSAPGPALGRALVSARAAMAAVNPKPVSGYAPDFQIELPAIPRNGIGPVMIPDGRFVIESIVHPIDQRVRVPDPSAWPYSVHGHMVMRFPNNKVFIGSGTLVGPHHVLTAGHCVFSDADGGYASDIVFNAAQNESTLPFGSVTATRVLTTSQYENGEAEEWDLGMLILAQDVANSAGHYAMKAFENDDDLHRLRVNVSGYPGDKGGEQMWTNADVVKNVSQERFCYDIDTMGGQSGSGVWTLLDGSGATVVGIHTTGSSSGNGGTRLTAGKMAILQDWLNRF